MSGVRGLGHVVLRVRELDRSERFYRDVLGMRVTARLGNRMSFLAAREGVSHEVALLALGPQAPGPDPHRVGLYHIAFQVDSLEELERRLRERGHDSPQQMALRLETARRELETADEFDYRVVNDQVEEAVERLARIMEEERRRPGRTPPRL